LTKVAACMEHNAVRELLAVATVRRLLSSLAANFSRNARKTAWRAALAGQQSGAARQIARTARASNSSVSVAIEL